MIHIHRFLFGLVVLILWLGIAGLLVRANPLGSFFAEDQTGFIYWLWPIACITGLAPVGLTYMLGATLMTLLGAAPWPWPEPDRLPPSGNHDTDPFAMKAARRGRIPRVPPPPAPPPKQP